MESFEVDTVIMGAGVVGLAIARALSRSGEDIWILEAEPQFGSQTSSRNSEVIHAGIYYPKDSLKAQFCVQGRKQLYAYCQEKAIPHRQCGKLIVATDADQVDSLQSIQQRAIANGIDDLQLLNARQIHELEPSINAVAGLWSPSTGILDSHTYMQHLLWDAEQKGVTLALNARVKSGDLTSDKKSLLIENVDASGSTKDTYQLTCKTLINAAGLQATEIARSLVGFPDNYVPPRYFARGHYFSLSIPSPFRHLIYPVPVKGGLGIHLTLDLANQAKFGPDVEWIDEETYRTSPYEIDTQRQRVFEQAIRQYWPDLPKNALQPAYAGIRPKIAGPGDADADFMIQTAQDHSILGLVNLFGIESPGLTASLAIADYVATHLSQ